MLLFFKRLYEFGEIKTLIEAQNRLMKFGKGTATVICTFLSLYYLIFQLEKPIFSTWELCYYIYRTILSYKNLETKASNF